MRGDNLYLQLIAVFAPLSLLSIGGGQSVVADIHMQSVEVHHWVTQAQFVDLFAISRAAPGPGALLTTLIGWHVAGWQGALIASLALFLPSSVLAYLAIRAWHRHRDRPWYQLVQRALAPLASGLILSSAFTVLRSSSGTLSLWVIAALSAILFSRFHKLNPLPVLVVAGVVQAVTRMLL
jgi:chromate transporter